MATQSITKIGTAVRFTRRNGYTDTGKVKGKVEAPNGLWILVETLGRYDRKVITKVRPSELQRA